MADWEKSIKEAEVRIGLKCNRRRRRSKRKKERKKERQTEIKKESWRLSVSQLFEAKIYIC